MATKTTNREFLSGDQSAEKIQRDFIQKPLDNAKQSILSSGFDLFNLMTILPDAFIASQRRELERVKETADDKDDRVAALEASIQQATDLRTTVQRGEVRVQRAIASLTNRENAFHGFISDSDFQPLSGLTVRLSGQRGTHDKRGLTATTDEDGYFRIPLGSKSDGGKEWRAKVAAINFAEKIDSMSGQPAAAAGTGSAEDKSSATRPAVQVEILQESKVVHTDPVGVPIDQGSVYREYVVAVEKSKSEAANSDVADMTSEEQVDIKQNISAKTATKRKSDTGRTTKPASKK